MHTPNLSTTLGPSPTTPEDWAEHARTYRYFVRGVLLFAAHVLVILLILAWVFSDSLGTPPVTS